MNKEDGKMSYRMDHWYSDEWCRDHHARTQEQLQEIAGKIRKSCKVTEIVDNGFNICTVYENKNLGVKYWIKDSFGHISEIDEARAY